MAEEFARVRVRAEDDTKGAFDSMVRSVQGFTGMLGGLQGTLATLGVGLSAGGFGLMIKGAIDAQAALDDLSEMTSLTVETLSSLQQVARIGGHSLDGVQAVATKFAKSVSEAAGGNKELLKSFDALGISQERLRNTKFDDLYVEFADKIANATNRTYAIAYATELAGKSAATAIPFFRDLAEEGMKQARVTAEQAAAAEKLSKDVNRLKDEFDGLKNSLALETVPWLQKMIDEMREGTRIAGGFWSALVQFGTMNPFKTPGEHIIALNADVSRLGAQRARMVEQGRTGWLPRIDEEVSSAQRSLEFAKFQQRREALASTGDVLDPNDRRLANMRAGGYDLPPPPKGGAEGAGTESPYRNLVKMLEQELQVKKELTASEKLLFELAHMRADVLAKIVPSQIAELKARAEAITQEQELRRAYEAQAKAAEEREKQQEQANQQIATFNQSASETLQALEFETAQLGRSNVEREVASALRKLDLDYQRALNGLTNEQIDQLATINALAKEKVGAAVRENAARKSEQEWYQQQIEASQRAAEESRRAWERTGDAIYQSLTDSVMRSFEAGEGFARTFGESLKRYFLSLGVSIPMRFVSNTVTGALSSAFPGLAGAMGNGNGNGGGFGGFGNMASLANQFTGNGFSLANVGAAGEVLSAGGGLTGAASTLMGGNMGIAAAGGAMDMGIGMAGMAEAFGAGGAAAGGMAAGAMAAVPYVGLALAAYSMFKKKKTPGVFTGYDAPSLSFGSGGLFGTIYGNNQKGERWGGEQFGGTFSAEAANTYAQFAQVGSRLGVNTSGLGSYVATVDAGAFTQHGEVLPRVMEQLSQQLARQILPNFDALARAGETAIETLTRLADEQDKAAEQQKKIAEEEKRRAEEVRRRAEEQLREQEAKLSGMVAGLPGRLGITTLTGFQDSLATSEFLSPVARLAASREQLSKLHGRAMGGDLDAVSAFPSLLQQTLGISRDVHASGPGFADVFSSGNRMLNDLLQRQQQIQQDLTRGLAVSVMESGLNTVKALREEFAASRAQQEEIIRLLRAAA